MDELPEPDALPAGFRGPVRLFPLPNVVMFPHVMQPLHIFEPRYRDMLRDALAADRLIAIGLLRPGWEASYAERPAVWPTVCIGRVVSSTRLDDGRYNILLLGLQRATITSELPPEQLYRRAEVRLLDDAYPAGGADERLVLRRQLLDWFRRVLPASAEAQGPFEQLLSSQVPLGMLADVVAFTARLDVALKQQLLAELDVDRRARRLLDALQQPPSAGPPEASAPPSFPPDFSAN